MLCVYQASAIKLKYNEHVIEGFELIPLHAWRRQCGQSCCQLRFELFCGSYNEPYIFLYITSKLAVHFLFWYLVMHKTLRTSI